MRVPVVSMHAYLHVSFQRRRPERSLIGEQSAMHVAQMRAHRALRGACIAVENSFAYPAMIRIHCHRYFLVRAIVIDAVSPTALNGTIKKACAAGVVVVSFDGIVDEPCAYRVNFDFKGWAEQGVDYLAQRLNGKGNILEVRGVAGISVDNLMHEGVLDAMKKHPGMNERRRRRALLCAGRHAARQDTDSRSRRKPDVRRASAQPAFHYRDFIRVCAACGRARRAEIE